ncbi:MAG: hypothetical protein NVS2B12_30760 [Ktedonobacteraceae bacterium]
MNNLLNKDTISSTSPVTKHYTSLVNKPLYLLTRIIVILAFVTGAVLLLCDLFLTVFPHAPLSAAPLLFIGVAYLGFQAIIRPTPLDLFKALIVSTAFILWGIDQLLPAGWFATTLGDVVIMLYVIDLGWVLLDRLRGAAGAAS